MKALLVSSNDFSCLDYIYPDFHVLNATLTKPLEDELSNTLPQVVIIDEKIKFESSHFESAKGLEAIIVLGEDYSGIDIDAANKNNVLVSTIEADNILGLTVAEFMASQALSAIRFIPTASKNKKFNNRKAKILKYMSVGIFGVNEMSSMLTVQLLKFGFSKAQISYFDPLLGEKATSIDSIFHDSDIIFIPKELDADTKNKIENNLLFQTKEDIVLVQVSDNPIDQNSLSLWLNMNQNATLMLDSKAEFKTELISCSNSVLTPGIATESELVFESLKNNLISLLGGLIDYGYTGNEVN